MKKLYILKSFLSLMILLGMTSITNAQENTMKNKQYGGFGYFLMGYQGYNLSAMNDALSGAGYPEIENGSIMIGGGGHYLVKNWLLGGEGYGLPGGTVENVNYKLSHGGGYGFFNLGYLVWQTPSFFLYPVLGIGGGGLTLNMKEKDQTTNSFDELVDDPGRESNLNNGGFLLNLSVMASYIILGEKEAEYTGGLTLGLKAGYILNTSTNNWFSGGEKLSGTPAAGISGPYLSIILGGGGSTNKN